MRTQKVYFPLTPLQKIIGGYNTEKEENKKQGAMSGIY